MRFWTGEQRDEVAALAPLATVAEAIRLPETMATILLLGRDDAVLEGVAQTLGAVGHTAVLARTPREAVELAAASPPLVALIERDQLLAGADVLRLPLAPGGAFVLYRTGSEPADPLPHSLARSVLADLTLPLERHRLIALVHHVVERAFLAGRETPQPPSAHRGA